MGGYGVGGGQLIKIDLVKDEEQGLTRRIRLLLLY